MDIHIYIYIVLAVIITILSYVTWNILRKYEALIDTLLDSEDNMAKIKASIAKSIKDMEEIDRKQMFETDDDVGQIFKQLKDIVKDLDRGE